MKTFTIAWTNCFMKQGTVKIEAESMEAAETQFDKDFGSDYSIIYTTITK